MHRAGAVGAHRGGHSFLVMLWQCTRLAFARPWQYADCTCRLLKRGTMVLAKMQEQPSLQCEKLQPIQMDQRRRRRHSALITARVDLVALGGIASDSTRFLGSDGYAEYWVGRGNAGNVCLIMAVKGEAQVVAPSCATITNFYRRGIGVVAGAGPTEPPTSAEAYLLPADITSDDRGRGMQARSSAQATHDSLISLRP